MAGVDFSNSELDTGLASIRARHSIPELPDADPLVAKETSEGCMQLHAAQEMLKA